MTSHPLHVPPIPSNLHTTLYYITPSLKKLLTRCYLQTHLSTYECSVDWPMVPKWRHNQGTQPIVPNIPHVCVEYISVQRLLPHIRRLDRPISGVVVALRRVRVWDLCSDVIVTHETPDGSSLWWGEQVKTLQEIYVSQL